MAARTATAGQKRRGECDDCCHNPVTCDAYRALSGAGPRPPITS